MRVARARLARALRGRGGEAGVTVVEISVALGLLMLAMATFLGAFESTQQTSTFVERRKTALNELRTTMATISKETRQASAVIVTPTSLKMKTYLEGTEAEVLYSVDAAGNLTRSRDGGAAAPVGLNVSDTTDVFTLIPATATDRPRVVIKLTTKPQVKYPDVMLTSEVVLRNAI